MPVFLRCMDGPEGSEDSSDTTNMVESICKQMINMEENEYIFPLGGKTSGKFNSYTYKGVKMDMSGSRYNILIYGDICPHELQNMITNYLAEIQIPTQKLRTINDLGGTRSDHFIDIHKKEKKRRLCRVYPEKTLLDANYNVVWNIMVIGKNVTNYLNITELQCVENTNLHDTDDSYYLSYLLSAPFTIIYDSLNIFDFKNPRRLNFPELNKYTMHGEGRIIDNIIYLGYNSDRRSNIDQHLCITMMQLHNPDTNKISLNDHVWLNIKTYTRLLNYPNHLNVLKFVYTETALDIPALSGDEIDFDNHATNYRCFATNVRLFGKVHVIELEFAQGIKKRVLCSDFAYTSTYGSKENASMSMTYMLYTHTRKIYKIRPNISWLGHIYLYTTRFVINSLDISFYEKALLEALHRHQIKKNTTVISQGGVKYSSLFDIYNLNTYCIKNEEYNLTFIGTTQLSDYHVLKYRNDPNIILFGIDMLRFF